jgi:hypothetical protein
VEVEREETPQETSAREAYAQAKAEHAEKVKLSLK